MMNEGKFQAALDAVDQNIAERGKSDQLMLVKGFLHIRLGQLVAAEQLYLELVQQMPDNPEVLNNLGVVYQLQKRLEEAVDQFKRVVEKFPEFARSYENLGDTYLQMAKRAYDQGVEQVPEDNVLKAKSTLSGDFHGIAKQNANPADNAQADVAQAENEPQAAEEVETQETEQPEAVEEIPIEQQLISFLESWIQGWSSLDAEAYFSHYSRDFVPADQSSLEDWVARKRRIISNAEFINVFLEDVEFETTAQDQVTISFRQSYESNTYQGTSNKELDLRNYEGDWFIIAER